MSEDRTNDAAELRRANQELARRLVRERVDFADRVQEALVEAERAVTDRDRLIEGLRRGEEALRAEMEALRAETEALTRRLESSDQELAKAHAELVLRNRELERLHQTRAYRFATGLRTVWKHAVVHILSAPFRLFYGTLRGRQGSNHPR
jgi:1,6-anhydro-N-acetylmuramate kinase